MKPSRPGLLEALGVSRARLRELRPIAYTLLVLLLCGGGCVHAAKYQSNTSWPPSHLAFCALTAACFTVGMEYYARWAHKESWHNGSLWRIHVTHHSPTKGLFEANDVFGIFNMLLILPVMRWAFLADPVNLGSAGVFGFTVGVSIFGTAYMVVHDGVVHGRFWTGSLGQVDTIRRVAEAHKMHHKTAEMGAPYGMFLGPHELDAEARGVEPSPMPIALKGSLLGCAGISMVSLLWSPMSLALKGGLLGCAGVSMASLSLSLLL